MPLTLFQNKKNRRIVFISVLCFFVFCFLLSLSYTRIFDAYENTLLDLRFRLRPLQKIDDKIIIVEISDDTLNTLGYWPIPRDFHASVVEVLKDLGAKQVVFDVIFTDTSAFDAQFSRAVRLADNVYFAHVFNIPFKLPKTLPEAKNEVASLIEPLKNHAKGVGFINTYTDSDGKIRWIPLFIKHQGNFEPQIALKVAMDYMDFPLEDIRFKNNKVIIDGQFKIPTSPSGAMLVNYSGKWKETFKHYSYVDIFAAYQAQLQGSKSGIDLSVFKDAVCFVGLTATGTSDLNSIPLENNYPMVGLHANVFNSLVHQHYVSRVSKTTNLVILCLLLFLTGWICYKNQKKPYTMFFSVLGVASVFWILSTLLFIFVGAWNDVFYPLVLIVLMYVCFSIYNFVTERHRREIIENELSIATTIQESFLPKPIESFENLEIAASMTPAKHVGGDLFDLKQLSETKFGVFLGDVSGKGVGAALVMAKTITTFRMLINTIESPAALLYALNNELKKDLKSGMFITGAYLVYDSQTHKITLASAGHLPTLVYRTSDGTVEKIDPKEGMPLGLMKNIPFSEEEVLLDEGDKVVLYSDGVTEARNRKKQDFEEKGLINVLKGTSAFNAVDTLQTIKSRIQTFVDKAPQHDDLTLIVLRKE